MNAENATFFSETPSHRIVYFVLSSVVLLLCPAMFGVFYVIYPENTVLLRLTKSFGMSLAIVVAQFAFVVWWWTLTKARWTKRYYQVVRRKAVLPIVAVPLCAFVYLFLATR